MNSIIFSVAIILATVVICSIMHLILKLSWGEKMKLYDLSIVLIVLAAVAALGIGSQFVLGDDNHVEEMAEEYVEDHIEEKFNLEDGTINLDFSPNSEESSD